MKAGEKCVYEIICECRKNTMLTDFLMALQTNYFKTLTMEFKRRQCVMASFECLFEESISNERLCRLIQLSLVHVSRCWFWRGNQSKVCFRVDNHSGCN